MRPWLVALILAGVLGAAPVAEAGLVRGLMKVLGGVIEIPRATLAGTMQQFPVGMVTGALGGVIQGLMMVISGTFEVLGSAIPLAGKLAPLIPIFI